MRYIGFMAILIVTGLLAKTAMLSVNNPEVVSAIAIYSPWVAAHAEMIGLVAAGIVIVAGLSVPPILMKQDLQNDEDRMGGLGRIISAASFAYILIFMAIPSLGFLIGIGWFAARKVAG